MCHDVFSLWNYIAGINYLLHLRQTLLTSLMLSKFSTGQFLSLTKAGKEHFYMRVLFTLLMYQQFQAWLLEH